MTNQKSTYLHQKTLFLAYLKAELRELMRVQVRRLWTFVPVIRVCRYVDSANAARTLPLNVRSIKILRATYRPLIARKILMKLSYRPNAFVLITH